MRVCYLIQSHTSLPQIVRLVHALRRGSPSAFILISHHSASFEIPARTFEGVDNVHVMHVTEAYRGDFSLVTPYLDAIQWLLDKGIDFDWLVNLTGQCYPVRPLHTFEGKLAEEGFDGYMQCFDALADGPDNIWGLKEARHRYEYQYWRIQRRSLSDLLRQALSIPRRIVNNSQPWIQLETGYGLMIGLRAQRPLFSENFRCFGGSQFKSLRRPCVEYLLRFTEDNPDVVAYFRRTVIPDETYVQTVIANNRGFRIHPDNLFYIRWDGMRLGHPRTLTAADMPDVVRSKAFFARKFSLVDHPDALDYVDD